MVLLKKMMSPKKMVTLKIMVERDDVDGYVVQIDLYEKVLMT